MHKFVPLILLLFPILLPAQQKGYIRAGQLNIYYERTGKGPAIVLLHAGYMDHTMWAKQVAALAATNTVITIDQPRHGLTQGSDSSILIADVLRICLDSLHIRKASFAGLSLGGLSIADFAIAYPDRVDKLIFVCSGLWGFQQVIAMDSVTRAVFQRSADADSTDDIPTVARAFAKDWAAGPFRDTTQLSHSVYRFVYEHVISTLNQHLNDHWVAFKKDPAQAMEVDKIRAPTLIIWAELDVPYIHEIAKYLHTKINRSTLHEMMGVAHMVNMEKPDEFNRLVKKFLGAK